MSIVFLTAFWTMLETSSPNSPEMSKFPGLRLGEAGCSRVYDPEDGSGSVEHVARLGLSSSALARSTANAATRLAAVWVKTSCMETTVPTRPGTAAGAGDQPKALLCKPQLR